MNEKPILVDNKHIDDTNDLPSTNENTSNATTSKHNR